MVPAEVALVKQRCVDVRLVDVVRLVGVARLLAVVRPRHYDGHALVALLVYDEPVFCESLHPVGVVGYGIGGHGHVAVQRMCRLPALSPVGQQLEAPLRHQARRLVVPAVHQAQRLHLGHVKECVAVAVVGLLLVVIIQEQGCRQSFVQLYSPHHIALIAPCAARKQVDKQRVGHLGLLVFYVYLPRHRLIAVLHRGGALRHLYALHPRPGHIVEPVDRSRAAQVGEVLGEHLHIGARKAQQLYLLGPGHGVAVSHVDRRVADETL